MTIRFSLVLKEMTAEPDLLCMHAFIVIVLQSHSLLKVPQV